VFQKDPENKNSPYCAGIRCPGGYLRGEGEDPLHRQVHHRLSALLEGEERREQVDSSQGCTPRTAAYWEYAGTTF